jgi:type 1 glutamine amidotransferase
VLTRRGSGLVAAFLAGALLVALLVLHLEDGVANPFGSRANENIGLQRVVIAESGPPDAWMKNIADLNGDGRPDLVVAGAQGPVVWYRNPDWKPFTIATSAASESGSAVGDVDRDGDADVVVGTTWYENRGGQRVWKPHQLGVGGTHDIVLADFDRDGKLDVAMRGETGSAVEIFFQRGKDSWRRVRLDPGFGRNGLDAGDIDGDGFPDLAVGGLWLANPGKRAARNTRAWKVRRFAPWSAWAGVKIVDMDRDGRPDVLLSVSERSGDIAWFRSPADPTRGAWTRYTVATGLDSVHSIDVADVDGDGRQDVVGSEFRGQGRLMVFDNLGRARAWAPLTVAHGEDLHNTRVADVTGDGLPDVLGAAPFGDNPVVLYESSRAGARRVLVFSKTLGFRHDSIPHAIDVLKQLGAANGFTVDATEDSRAFTRGNLARYRAVVFLNPSGNVLNAAERQAFRRYIEAGHGFVGIHNATALVLEDWPWYTRLVSARYVSEIATQPLRLVPVDRTDPSTKGIPDPWLITEEAYNFDVDPRTRGAKVLVTLDESYSRGGTMGPGHPFSWRKAYDGGRSWYTNGGANSADYDNRVFVDHVLGGIRWAGGF